MLWVTETKKMVSTSTPFLFSLPLTTIFADGLSAPQV